jgi:N6-L-threonylcarbamoyladenine synthase
MVFITFRRRVARSSRFAHRAAHGGNYGYMLVLGLESSCDDCSAAVVEESGGAPRLLSLVREGQDALHAPYGGVVPELAAREHLVALRRVAGAALARSGASASDLGRVAATRGPGLIGCLLTTFSAGKAMAWRLGLPFVGVHHALGHINAARFGSPRLPFPALALLVSGGHTHLYLAEGWTSVRLLMKTRDDAAGEAFDKAARALGLGYPGGAAIDACAQSAPPGPRGADPVFTPPRFRDGAPSWSFSGLKAAVRRLIDGDPRVDGRPGMAAAGPGDPRVGRLCRALNRTIASWLLDPLPGLIAAHGAASLIVSGGVACNSELRAGAAGLAARLGVQAAIPEPRLCTDNGAMVAAAGALLPHGADFWGENADADAPLNCSFL